MMRQNSHSGELKGISDGLSQRRLPNRIEDIGMRKDIDGAARAQCREACRANPVRFSFVDKCQGAVGDRICNGGSFTVVQGLGGGANDQLLEMLLGFVDETDDIHKTGTHEFIEAIGILPAPRPACFQLRQYDIDDRQAIGQRAQYIGGTSGGIETYDDAGIGNDKHGRVSQAG